MFQLRRRLKQAQRQWRERRYLLDEFTPRQTWPDDIFIVSYPRSGNTWVRFLVGNLIKPPDLQLTLRNINAVVPPVLALPHQKHALARPRFIKSHSPYNPAYPRVIYVLRDGRDAYASYFAFLRKQLPEDLTLAEFMSTYEPWPCRWEQHVVGWLDRGLSAEQLLTVRYEDLKRNAAAELARIVRFAGLQTTPEALARAVEDSSFEAMRRLEAAHGGPRNDLRDGSFVRSGQVSGWRNALTSAESTAVDARLAPTLTRFGYQPTPAGAADEAATR